MELLRDPENGEESLLFRQTGREDMIGEGISYDSCNYLPSEGARSIRHLP